MECHTCIAFSCPALPLSKKIIYEELEFLRVTSLSKNFGDKQECDCTSAADQAEAGSVVWLESQCFCGARSVFG